ncbi:MAG: hypothetical protein LBL24_09275 [Bacteroidales bacterium]|jgi:hypothetical protein|nr:hypothetical protein [Bacteroidales bacterium]
MRKNLYLLLLAACSAGLHAQDASDDPYCQRYASSQKKYTFAIQPMQFFNSALRFDYEMRLGDGPGWLQFGPAVYCSFKGNANHPDYYYDGDDYYHTGFLEGDIIREPCSKIRGGGLDVNYKRFINPARSFYLAAGLSYACFGIRYWGRVWTDYTEDGLEYHEYGLDYRTQHINRLGINTYFGYQIPTRRAFLFDMFAGLAYRHSFAESGKQPFNKYMLSYGYTGAVFLTGVRIGFGLK